MSDKSKDRDRKKKKRGSGSETPSSSTSRSDDERPEKRRKKKVGRERKERKRVEERNKEIDRDRKEKKRREKDEKRNKEPKKKTGKRRDEKHSSDSSVSVSMTNEDEKKSPKRKRKNERKEEPSQIASGLSMTGSTSGQSSTVSSPSTSESKSKKVKAKSRPSRTSRKKPKTTTDEEESTETSVRSDDSGEGSETGGGGADDKRKIDEERGLPAAEQLADTRDPLAFDETKVDQKHKFQIRCRVVEAKELQGANIHPLCRVFIGNKMRYTRTRRATNAPVWDQSLHFSIQKSLEELSKMSIEFKVYTARRLISDALLGAFKCNIGLIYKQPQHCIINKWLALTRSMEGESEDLSVTGFLKVSITVLLPGQRGPVLTGPGKTKDDFEENVLFGMGAQFRYYTLQLRIFEMSDLPPFRKKRAEKGIKELYAVAVQACLGQQTLTSKFVWSEQAQVGQEIMLPLMWPSVVKNIQLRLLEVQAKVKKLSSLGRSDWKNANVVGTIDLSIQSICCPGEDGYLPTFGPAYLNFYGMTDPVKGKKLSYSDASYSDGSAFCGRILLEVNTLPQKLERPKLAELSQTDLMAVQKYRNRSRNTLYCSFFSASNIDPEYKRDMVSFEVTIGQYGNSSYDSNQTHRASTANRTPAVAPYYDGRECYGMPWGNYKPCCEVLCNWEDCNDRMYAVNFLLSLSSKLKDKANEVRVLLGSNVKENKLAATILSVIEQTRKILSRSYLENVKVAQKTELDGRLLKLRLDRLARLATEMAKDKFIKVGTSDELAVKEGGYRLVGYAHQIDALANEVQINIPDIVIRMLCGRKGYKSREVAFARIPPASVIYGKSKSRGQDCGKIMPVFLKWSCTKKLKTGSYKVPALLHVRLWLSSYDERNKWDQIALDQASMKTYAEVWQNQKKKFMRKGWDADDPSFSDERQKVGLTNVNDIVAPSGWKFSYDWCAFSVHKMWTTKKDLYAESSISSAGTDTESELPKTKYEHVYYEVQKKAVGDVWKLTNYTDAEGRRLMGKFDPFTEKAPDGWHYKESEWQRDPEGWVYSVTKEGLAKEACQDKDERVNHRYRRRRYFRGLTRTKPSKRGSQKSHSEMDAEILVPNVSNSAGWEYCVKFGESTHDYPRVQDRIRRRRLLREIEPDTKTAESATFARFSLKINSPKAGRRKKEPKPGKSSKSHSRTASDTTQSSVPSAVSRTSSVSAMSESGASSTDYTDIEAGMTPKAAFLTPRMYVVYDRAITKYWQLRAYIFWGRDMLPIYNKGTNAFVRVVFMTVSKETLAVKDCVNPIWNETLLFKKVSITGADRRILDEPPHCFIEVLSRNETPNPDFLGRFSAEPTVILDKTSDYETKKWKDSQLRSRLQWYQLQFGRHGSVLATFELMPLTKRPDSHKWIPERERYNDELRACVKTKGVKPARYSVPKRISLKFIPYDIQFICWGLRNLKRYRLTHLKSPYIQILVADKVKETIPIADVRKNPNFADPVITLMDVRLPENLYLAPPMTLHLYDKRMFGSRPLIGVCLIKDLKLFVEKKVMNFNKTHQVIWTERRQKLIEENDKEKDYVKKEMVVVSEEKVSDAPEIDWWSKFYASVQEQGKYPGYLESGLHILKVYSNAIEDEPKFKGFKDFSQTFEFRKMKYGRFDEAELTDYRGELKGRLFVYERASHDKPNEGLDSSKPPGLEFTGPTECLVRIYMIRAFDLASRRRSGKCDPYIEVRCGKHKKISKRKQYVPDTLEPTFGQLVECSVSLPQDKSLIISIKDKRLFTVDEEIGSTEIDLEDRLLTKHRATVGLAAGFYTSGPTQWRDQMNPIAILEHYCKVHQLEPPEFMIEKDVLCMRVGMNVSYSSAEVEGEKKPSGDAHLGSPHQRLALKVLRQLKVGLVPEHIETRPLHNSLNPDTMQGKMQMWVDVFPKPLGPIPPPINITPRKPKQYQLRLVVWNTRDVFLEKKSFGDKIADIYVKAFLNGEEITQKTDVQYRSTDGSASFNWRMVFNVDYNPWEKNMIVKKRRHWFRRATSETVAPEVVIQVWDNHKFGKDHYLGQIRMNLRRMEEGQLDASKMRNVNKPRLIKLRRIASLGCWKPKPDGYNMKYQPYDGPMYSLFDQQRSKGWWPVFRESITYDQRTNTSIVTGKVELEFELLNRKIADKYPAGKARKKPNEAPFLPKPDRPMFDSFWLTSRIKALWKKTRWFWILIIIVAVIVGLLVLAFIFDVPGLIAGTGKSGK